MSGNVVPMSDQDRAMTETLERGLSEALAVGDVHAERKGSVGFVADSFRKISTDILTILEKRRDDRLATLQAQLNVRQKRAEHDVLEVKKLIDSLHHQISIHTQRIANIEATAQQDFTNTSNLISTEEGQFKQLIDMQRKLLNDIK